MPHRANLRSISSAVRRAQRPKFAFYLSRGPDFRRRTGIFRPRARYFPWMESTQRSPGRRPHKVRFTRNTQAWAFLVRSLARPLPTTTQGRGWVPGGSAPYNSRTRSAHLGRTPNLFGAGMNLGPLRPPPAAARIYQLHASPLFPLAPLVCLAFPAPLGSFLAPCMARWRHRALQCCVARRAACGCPGVWGCNPHTGAEPPGTHL